MNIDDYRWLEIRIFICFIFSMTPEFITAVSHERASRTPWSNQLRFNLRAKIQSEHLMFIVEFWPMRFHCGRGYPVWCHKQNLSNRQKNKKAFYCLLIYHICFCSDFTAVNRVLRHTANPDPCKLSYWGKMNVMHSLIALIHFFKCLINS